MVFGAGKPRDMLFSDALSLFFHLKCVKSSLSAIKQAFLRRLPNEIRDKAVRFQRMPVEFDLRPLKNNGFEVFLACLDAIFSECREVGKIHSFTEKR